MATRALNAVTHRRYKMATGDPEAEWVTEKGVKMYTIRHELDWKILQSAGCNRPTAGKAVKKTCGKF